jgi:hypothetical protein
VGDDYSLENQMTIIKPENILNILATISSNQSDILPVLYSPDPPTQSQLFQEAYTTNPFPKQVLQILKDGTKQYKDITLAECEEHNNLLLY